MRGQTKERSAVDCRLSGESRRSGRETEVFWTVAVPPPRPIGAFFLARLAGEAGLGWLGQEHAALRVLAAYFGDGPSELRAVACEAERRFGLALDRGPHGSAPDAPPRANASLVGKGR